ncbi:MAG TPA: DUF929 family protein [Actinocrinis sp.]|nr:DUF929 family protein [Actinocrinis sp.]
MSAARPTTPTNSARSPKSTASSRRKIAEQRAADQRRRRQIWLAGTGIGVVVAILATLVAVKAAGSGGAQTTAAPPATVSTQTTHQVVTAATAVPAADLAAVGSGAVADPAAAISHGTPLTSGGKPEILYMGAEYCPFCAAERWPLVVALSRFGTFTGLQLTKSSSTDEFPSTNTFTFLHATYTSKYLAFDTVELQDVNRNPLQTPTAAQQQLLDTYDAAPYTSSPGAIPFVDFGNQFVVSGASYDPQVLQGQSWSTIAAALSDPSSAIGKSIDGAANRLTAAICSMTGDQPSNVCSAPSIISLKAGL